MESRMATKLEWIVVAELVLRAHGDLTVSWTATAQVASATQATMVVSVSAARMDRRTALSLTSIVEAPARTNVASNLVVLVNPTV